jgi:hypothetical protein
MNPQRAKRRGEELVLRLRETTACTVISPIMIRRAITRRITLGVSKMLGVKGRKRMGSKKKMVGKRYLLGMVFSIADHVALMQGTM